MSQGQGKAATVSIDEELLANGLTRYHLEPPSWRAPWLGTSQQAANYPQFYPTRDGQEEDQLTESAVKQGFSGKTVVGTETFSAHQMIYEKLKGGTILPALTKLATAVSERAQSRVASYGPSTFRLPSRVTLHEQKRESWFNDLANPAIPLSKLSRTVPHGYRGEKLLDMLFARQAPIARAVWYIRAMGAVEIAGMKGRLGVTAAVTQYTREWTTTMLEYVKKMLSEVALPEPAPVDTRGRASTRLKAKQVLADSDLRSIWSAKFSYILSLLEALYEEHLIDRDSFLRLVVHHVESSNTGQLPFVLFLAEEYLGEFLLSEPFSARLVYACFSRLAQLSTATSTTQALEETSQACTSLIRSTFIALPDAFVASPLWTSHSTQLEALMLSTPGLEPALAETIRSDLADLKARAEAANEGTNDADSVESDDLETIQILDNLTFPADLSAVRKSLFYKRRRRRPLSIELPILFTWSTTPDRSGSHRPYAVAALISLELQASNESCDVEAGFMKWVDGSVPERRRAGVVRELLSELIRVRAVSYSLYLQRMIARGETEEREGVEPSLHLQLLRSVALYEEVGNPLAKRRIALRASASAKADSAKLVETAQLELLSLVPGLGADLSPPNRDVTSLTEALQRLTEDGSQLIITRRLIPQGVSRLAGGVSLLAVEDHAILTHAFQVVGDLSGLLQYLIIVLRSRPNRDLLLYVLDVVEGDLDAWTSMGALASLASALMIAYEGLSTTGTNDRRLVALLRRLAAAGHLEAGALAQLEEGFQALVLSLSTTRPQLQPLTGTQDLQSLLVDSSPQAISSLASTLWYRHHAFDNWGVIIIDSAVLLLSQAPVNVVTSFLRAVKERLPAGLEHDIRRWISSKSAAGLAATFGGALVPSVEALFSELVLDGTITATGVVSGVVLPAWRALLVAATAVPISSDLGVSTQVDPGLLRALEAISNIFSHLVVGETSVTLSATDLLLCQRSASRRMSLYTPSSLPDVGRAIAMLVIQQELWTATDHIDKVQETTQLLVQISSWPAFQMAVARDPETFATSVIDHPLAILPVTPSYRPKLLAALLLILKDGSTATPASLVSTEDWDLFLSGLTIWRLAVSKVEVQACLERLETDDSLQDAEKLDALHTLSRHFLDRVCSGEGHTYLGEQVVRCYHGRASDELVSVAFTRLADAIDGLSESASPALLATSLTALRCIGRLLNTLLQSAGSASSREGPLNQLLASIKARLEALLQSSSPPQRESLLHSTHLLGIALRCAPACISIESCELFKECLVPSAKLAAVLSRDRPQESELATVLLDTCSHVLFNLTKLAPTARLPSLQTFVSSDGDLDNLPDSTISRLTRLFGPCSTTSCHANPWELIDHADPGAPKDLRHNVGPIDLALFDAKVIEPIPLVTALDVPHSPATTSSCHSERGVQTNFDFETPCVGLSLEARDHRRTLTGSKRTTSRYDPNAKKVAPPDKSPPPRAKASSATVAKPLSTTSTSATAKGKRKDPPDVVVIDSDSDEAPVVRAPPAKRGRGGAAAKSGGRGGGRKKPKT